MINIEFIAKKSNVSIATVSRVLNNSKPVSEELRRRVLDTVEKYKYLPNSTSRSIAPQRPKSIGVLVSNFSNQVQTEKMKYIEYYAAQYGYNIVCARIDGNIEKAKQNLIITEKRFVDGIIVACALSQRTLKMFRKESNLPLLASFSKINDKIARFCINDWQAGYDVASYFISLGHTRLGGIFTPIGNPIRLRKQGYCQAILDHGLELNDKYITSADMVINGGYTAIQRIVKKNEYPTAIFCAGDIIALGAINYLKENGYRIPEDISFMGFDDLIYSKAFPLYLSTVAQPLEIISKKLVDALVALIEKEEPNIDYGYVPHELIIRDTCKNLLCPSRV